MYTRVLACVRYSLDVDELGDDDAAEAAAEVAEVEERLQGGRAVLGELQRPLHRVRENPLP